MECAPFRITHHETNFNFMKLLIHITLFISIIVFVELTFFHIIFPNISHIQSECGKHHEIFYGIISIPHNTAMDLNNVMKVQV